jgi:hypothetical protein
MQYQITIVAIILVLMIPVSASASSNASETPTPTCGYGLIDNGSGCEPADCPSEAGIERDACIIGLEYAKQQAEQYQEDQQLAKEFCSDPKNRQYCEEETEGGE